MITQRRLQHLLALVEHGHFGRAANALNISQPALSKSILALEDELGVQLLERKRGMVALTAFGTMVLERGKLLLTAEEDLRHEVALLSGLQTGLLKLALGPYPSVISGYLSIARLFAKHPKLSITVHVAGWREVARQVLSREVDLGIAELSSLDEEELATEPVAQHRAYLFCRPGHPLVGCGPVSMLQALEFPWAGTRLPPRVASRFPNPPGAAGAIDLANGDFVPAIEIDVPMQLSQILTDSDALAVGTLKMFDADILAGRVSIVHLSTPQFRGNYGFIYLKNRSLAPATLAFMNEVRAAEAEIVEQEAAVAKRYFPSGSDVSPVS